MMRSFVFNAFPLIVLTAALSAPAVQADGLQDNHPDKVRRIPKLGIEINAAQRSQLEEELSELKLFIDTVGKSLDANDELLELLPDVEIFYRAAHDALLYQEFFKPKEIDDALALIRLGKQRAKRLMVHASLPQRSIYWAENPESGLVVRGFRSRIDDSVQPYGLVIPENYSHQDSRGYRLDVWFHGRGELMSENVFLTQRLKNKGVFAPERTIVLHPYGRYSNAFKFAGEVDVLEAIEHVRQHYNIDDDRISVRGFSMGGAACWQFAVHYADRWFAANPGAGFSETPEFLKFFQKETLAPTWFEEKLWRMYDCNLWSKNLLHCPTVAYSGEDDIQKQAADIMEAALDEHDVKLVHVIGPKTGHRYHPDAAAEVAERLDQIAVVGRDHVPTQVDFVTYTLKYNRMHWLTVDSLEQHWEPANVRAVIGSRNPQIDIAATNVTALTVDIPAGGWPHPVTEPVKVFVNGKGGDVIRAGSDRSLQLSLHRRDNDWKAGRDPRPGLRKIHQLQGPIDDALMDSFIFVRPTGSSSNPEITAWANAELTRAIEHWRRHFRGYARVKDDVEITPEDIKSANLVLWGDAQSNRLLRQIKGQLPIHWGREQIQRDGVNYDAKTHALICVYPNPLNPKRYVVLNSSFTFRDYAYLNNARQVAKLPDWAIVDIRVPASSLWPGKIVDANFFDENWQLK